MVCCDGISRIVRTADRMDTDMLPSGVSRWGIRVVRLFPEPVLRALLPKRLQFDGADAHRLKFPATRVRLFIGPVNFARQGYAWARAAERLPDVGAVSMAYYAAGDYGFAVDQAVPASTYLMSRRWSREQSSQILSNATHVIVEAGRHLFGDVYGQTVLDEINQMRAAGSTSHSSATAATRDLANVIAEPFRSRHITAKNGKIATRSSMSRRRTMR